MSESGGFLSRWSRLKRTAEPAPSPEVEGSDASLDPAPEPSPPAAPEAAPTVPMLSEEELAALPRVEDLMEGSDIRGFLRPGVPAALRNAALRRMWMLTPAIRDYRDPAVDYAWDWNTPGGVPGAGCAPSPEKAAQMLRKLVEKPAPAPGPEVLPVAPDPEGPGGAVGGDAAGPAKGAGEADSPAAAASETPLIADLSQGEKSFDLKDKPEEQQPRRRHGGALPEV